MLSFFCSTVEKGSGGLFLWVQTLFRRCRCKFRVNGRVGTMLACSRLLGRVCWPRYHQHSGSEWHSRAGELGDRICIRTGNLLEEVKGWVPPWGEGLRPTQPSTTRGWWSKGLWSWSRQASMFLSPQNKSLTTSFLENAISLSLSFHSF